MNTVPYGSTGKIAQSIADRARKAGNEVYFVCGWTKQKGKALNETEIVATNVFSKAAHLVLSKMTNLDGCFSIISTFKLIRKLKAIEPDIIHMHIMHDYFINLPLFFNYVKKSKTKIIWTFHDCWGFTGGCPYFSISECEQWRYGCNKCLQKKKWDRLSWGIPKKMWRLKFRFAKSADLTVTVPSKWLAGVVEESFYKTHRIQIIHNGLDLDTFRNVKSDFREKINCLNKYIILGVAFDWGERKGLDVFNELAKKIPENYKIVLVGTNQEIDSKLHRNIYSIHKTSNQAELVKIYSAVDVFVNPTREEVFGMVNIEALACGTPVVTFNTDGAPEGIDSSCGFVVEEKTAEGLLPYIYQVCEEKVFDSESCRKRAELFKEEECYNKYLELYQNI